MTRAAAGIAAAIWATFPYLKQSTNQSAMCYIGDDGSNACEDA